MISSSFEAFIILFSKTWFSRLAHGNIKSHTDLKTEFLELIGQHISILNVSCQESSTHCQERGQKLSATSKVRCEFNLVVHMFFFLLKPIYAKQFSENFCCEKIVHFDFMTFLKFI